jgi:hypothetical protein
VRVYELLSRLEQELPNDRLILRMEQETGDPRDPVAQFRIPALRVEREPYGVVAIVFENPL